MKTREKVLEAIAGHWAERLVGPTYEEIGERAGGIGKPTVLYHLRRLEAEGLVTLGRSASTNAGQSRTVRLVEKAKV